MKLGLKLTSVWILGTLISAVAAQAGDPPAKTDAIIAQGQKAYTANCITCHGAKGDGMGDAGQYMSPKPRNFAKDPFKKGNTVSAIFTTVSKGIDGTAMAGFPALSEADRWAVSYYVLNFIPAAKPAK